MDAATLSARARQLGSVLEPLTGQVYFSPECHANYAALGFSPSAAQAGGVALPDGPAYFTSRGSVMGQVPGTVVAAAFAVFNPEVVVPAVTYGWTLTDAATICAARDAGAIAQLERLLGPSPDGIDRVNEILGRAVDTLRPEGRPLFAGLRSQVMPDSPMGRMWRLGDMLREYRSYSRTRAWSDAQFDAAHDRLRSRGLVDDVGFTPDGRAFREDIEVRTDAQMRNALEAIGDDVDELVAITTPWGATVRAGFGYLSSGPHDLASAAQR